MRLWRRRPHALIWTFLRVSISRFRGLCRSSSAYSPTMRPVPGIWRRLGGRMASPVLNVGPSVTRSGSRPDLGFCAAVNAVVTRA